jgi:hypothetical protein
MIDLEKALTDLPPFEMPLHRDTVYISVVDRNRNAVRILRAQQVVPGTPYQINASDLRNPQVATAMRRKGRPCQSSPEIQIPMFTDT